MLMNDKLYKSVVVVAIVWFMYAKISVTVLALKEYILGIIARGFYPTQMELSLD
jgi:hypothetical protein